MKKMLSIVAFVIIAGMIFVISGKIKNSANTANLLDSSQIQTNMYRNPAHGFSFAKLSRVTVGEFTETSGVETIVVEHKEENKTSGFQILITAFDDPDTTLTTERIKKDIPDMKIENEKEVFVGDTTALAFESDNSVFGGVSFEIWFVRDGNLYQISGYGYDRGFMEQTLSAWKWE